MPDENPDLGDAWLRGYVTRRRKLYNPNLEFDKAARKMCAVGYLGSALASIILILEGLSLRSPSLDGLVFLLLVAAPSVTAIKVGLSLMKRRPWARKAAAVLSALGMAAVACLFLLLWIAVCRSVVSGSGLGGLGRFSRCYWEYGMAVVFTLSPAFLLVWSGWRLFFATEYFSSREAKQICGETGGEAKGAP